MHEAPSERMIEEGANDVINDNIISNQEMKCEFAHGKNKTGCKD